MFDPERLRALAELVGGFYVRDRTLIREQKKITAALAAGSLTETDAAGYLRAVRTYFTGFEREARAHLKHVDRELERLYQLQYNLTAERGVAVRRIEATQGVLAAIAEIALE